MSHRSRSGPPRGNQTYDQRERTRQFGTEAVVDADVSLIAPDNDTIAYDLTFEGGSINDSVGKEIEDIKIGNSVDGIVANSGQDRWIGTAETVVVTNPNTESTLTVVVNDNYHDVGPDSTRRFNIGGDTGGGGGGDADLPDHDIVSVDAPPSADVGDSVTLSMTVECNDFVGCATNTATISEGQNEFLRRDNVSYAPNDPVTLETTVTFDTEGTKRVQFALGGEAQYRNIAVSDPGDDGDDGGGGGGGGGDEPVTEVPSPSDIDTNCIGVAPQEARANENFDVTATFEVTAPSEPPLNAVWDVDVQLNVDGSFLASKTVTILPNATSERGDIRASGLAFTDPGDKEFSVEVTDVRETAA